MNLLVDVEHVHFGYVRQKPVLHDLTLKVYDGEIVGLLGANGAGKTTTFELLNGVLRPNSGTIKICSLSPFTDASAVRRITGFVPDEPSLQPMLTGAENLNFFGLLWDVPRDELQTRAASLLNDFGLWNSRNEWVRSYSR